MKLRNAAVFTIWAFVMGNSQPLNAQNCDYYGQPSRSYYPGLDPAPRGQRPLGWMGYDPKPADRISDRDWIETERYRRDHILPHVVPQRRR